MSDIMSRSLSVHQEHEFLGALERAGLNKSLAQAVISGNDNEQARKVVSFMKNGFQLASELPFADEELESSYAYPPNFQFRSPVDQLLIWRERFPYLDGNFVERLAQVQLPTGAESIAVVPKPSKVGGYRAGLDKMLEFLPDTHPFKNWHEVQLGPECFRLALKTAGAIARLEGYQPGGYLVFPYQFGMEHRGKSVRRARVTFSEPEFGLCPYGSGALLVTHPDRITGDNHLYIDCAGAEYSPHADGQFGRAPFFRFGDDELKFGTGWVDSAYEGYGSASGFVS